MAGKQSIGELHAKITANGSQFVQEFNRADNAARRSTARIDAELDKLAKSFKKKFTLGDVGKDVLKGAGLFGGFAIADTAANQVVKYFEEQAKNAQDTEASTQRQMEMAKQMMALNRTELQQLEAMRVERERTWKALEGAKAAEQTDDQIKKVNELTEAYAKQSLEVLTAEKARERTLEDETDSLVKQLNDADKRVSQAMGGRPGAFSVGLSRGDLIAGAQARREAIFHRKAQIEGQMSVESLTERVALSEELVDVQTRLNTLLDREAQLGREVGEAFAAGMEDAILSGQKFSDVLRNLGQDLLSILVRDQITSPMAKMISGGFTSFISGFGGARADGGPVAGGTPYMVGERGPEMFVPGRSGSIVPNHALGGGGGIAVYQTNNFASGVTRQEVAAILPEMIESSKRAVIDAVARGGGFRKAFA